MTPFAHVRINLDWMRTLGCTLVARFLDSGGKVDNLIDKQYIHRFPRCTISTIHMFWDKIITFPTSHLHQELQPMRTRGEEPGEGETGASEEEVSSLLLSFRGWKVKRRCSGGEDDADGDES